MRWLLLVATLVTGCDARFINLCAAPDCPYASPAGADLSAPAADLSGADLGGAMPDLSGLGPEGVLAAGSFQDRAGHVGSGDAELYRRSDGRVELRLGASFRSSAVPGPAVFLTSRTDMGATIDVQSDINLGTLRSPTGAQSYLVPSGADTGRRNVFVFCQPFRVEVTKAALVDR